jgi:hypothetical protein
MLFILTWKKDVEPRVMIGERTSGLDTTWIRNTSAMDRLQTARDESGRVEGNGKRG